MQGSFLPTSLNEWLALAASAGGLLFSSWALAVRTIRGPLEAAMEDEKDHRVESFKAQGERIGGVESKLDINSANIENTDRRLDRIELEGMAMREQYGRVELRLDEIRDLLDTRKDVRHQEHLEIVQRLTAMETRLGVMSPHLKGGG